MNTLNEITLFYTALIIGVIFACVDATFTFFFEDTVNNWMLLGGLDEKSTEVLSGGLSAAVSILIAGYVRVFLNRQLNIVSNPLVDALGIIIGVVLYVSVYTVGFKKKKKKKRAEIL